MKFHHPILLFLLPTISTTAAALASSADLTSNAARPTDPSVEPRDVANANGEVLGASAAGTKGASDAPVDGKPHAGVAGSAEGGDLKEYVHSQGKGTVSEGSEKFDATVSSLGKLDSGAGAGAGAGVGAGAGTGAQGTGTMSGKKEAPLVYYSGQRKEDAKEAGEPKAHTKPAYNAEKPHDVPYSKSPASVKDDPYTGAALKGPSSVKQLGDEELPAGSPLHSLVFSFTMIIVSEIGDKTFLVAALMAMRHPRFLVFSAAFSALIGMTILSAVLGHGIPTLIPKTFTKFMAALLFFIFGLKMLKEGREMDPDEGVGEEMREVEQELEEKEQEQLRLGRRRRSSVTPHSLEAGRLGSRRQSRASNKNRMPSPPESLSSSSSRESSPTPTRRWNDVLVGMNNLFSLLLSPAWVQTFAMTFLGEWGDRSQIATIAMAAGQDYWWVTVGAATGHGICTAAAVIGGSAIAGKVSMRVVTLGGATAFLVFGVIYLIEALY